ncbi:MAG: hypothetical protein ACK559_19975, partial [bacterium]
MGHTAAEGDRCLALQVLQIMPDRITHLLAAQLLCRLVHAEVAHALADPFGVETDRGGQHTRRGQVSLGRE